MSEMAEHTKRKPFTVRLSELERQQIEEAAWIRKVPMAEWIRSVTVATAKVTIAERSKLLR